MAANSPRFATALLLTLVCALPALPARAAGGTVVVSAKVTPRMTLRVEPVDEAISSLGFRRLGVAVPNNGSIRGTIVVGIESNVEWEGFVAAESSGGNDSPDPALPLIDLTPVDPAQAGGPNPLRVGTEATPWIAAAPAGRSTLRYDVLLSLGDSTRSAPVTLVFVAKDKGSELTADARIAVG
jgi:hypothetical protein